MSKNKPTYIVVHTSDSSWGTAEDIDAWHRERGWEMIGYHYVIENGRVSSKGRPSLTRDGAIEAGRSEDQTGAHARGYNAKSIGICLIGKNGKFTHNQLGSLYALLTSLCFRHQIKVDAVVGHYETEQSGGKTCPDLKMDRVRKKLATLFTFFKSQMLTFPELKK